VWLCEVYLAEIERISRIGKHKKVETMVDEGKMVYL
jgi:hypothetical protein